MTFSEIKTAIKDYCNLTSTDADTRVGKAVNRHYRRITSSLGLNATRFVTRSVAMTVGQQTVTFLEIEKIDRIRDVTTATAIRLLQEVGIHEIRSNQPGTSEPTRWALQATDADSAVVIFDTIPQSAYSLAADGWTTLSDLSGSDEPVIPESFHDILVWYVISEELLKKEKEKLALTYAQKAENLLGELRFHLADSPTYDTPQGAGTAFAGTGGGGGGNAGDSAYTQTGLITFDRDPSAPFAVTDTSAYVPNLFTEGVGNVTTDRLIGRDTAATGESEQLTVGGGIEFTGSGGIQTSALTGDVTKAAGGTATTIAALAVATGMIQADAVTFPKIQNIATDSLLGRDTASTGDVENILLNATLSMDGSGNLQRAALTGDVTASAGSNATTIANDAVTFAKFQNITDARLLGRSAGSDGDMQHITVGTGLTLSGGALSAGSSAMTLLRSNQGSTTTTTNPTTLDSVAISGLTALDTLRIVVWARAVTQACANIKVYNATDAVDLGETSGINAGATNVMQMWGRQSHQGSTVAMFGGIKTGTSTAIDDNFEVPTVTNWQGTWTLELRHTGITAGGTLYWHWAVYKWAGQ